MEEAIVYTIDETAALLKVSRSTIRNMMKRGELHAVKVGASVRITAAELDRILHPEPGALQGCPETGSPEELHREPEPDPEPDTPPNG